MILGWSTTIIVLLIIGFLGKNMSSELYLGLIILNQSLMLIADCPADGYCVEMGKLESIENRGKILITGQVCRFVSGIFFGLIQTFLLGGPETNPNGKSTFLSWGLTFSQFYFLLAGLCTFFSLPLLLLKEPKRTETHKVTIKQWGNDMLNVLSNKASARLYIAVIFISSFGQLTPTNLITNFQYYVVEMNSILSGVNTVTTGLTLVFAVLLFKKYLIRINWRYSNILMLILTTIFSCLWILSFNNIGNLRHA